MPADIRLRMEECGIRISELYDGVRVCTVNIDMVKAFYRIDTISSGAAIDQNSFNDIFNDWEIDHTDRFNTFRTFKRQIEWLSGRITFSALDNQYLGGGHRLSHIEGGAPVIESLPNSVSVTHSGKYAAAAISLDPAVTVGIDLERIRTFQNRESFLRVAFPEENSSDIMKLSDTDIIRMWTLKESFLKIVQLGFAENLKNVRILPDRFVYKGIEISSLKRTMFEFDSHFLSVVSGDADKWRSFIENTDHGGS